MVTDVIAVDSQMDQEHAALLALKNSLKAIPVVDAKNRFLGVMTFDTILRVLDSEAVENILRMGGVYTGGQVDDTMRLSIKQSLSRRLPWLLIGLLGGFLTAGIIRGFEEILHSNLMLAAFIPLIVYMADAVSSQMQVLLIRDISVNRALDFFKYAIRQSYIVLCLGLCTGLAMLAVSYAIYRDLAISLVLCLALLLAVFSSLVSGIMIPYFFSRLKFDPANASGPIATIIQDTLSVLIYFVVATMLL